MVALSVVQTRKSVVAAGAMLVALGSIPLSALAQPTIFPEPLSPRIANYNIKVSLDDVAKRIDALSVLTWKNTSADTIDELQFHLYTNAFKNAKSTWNRERSRSVRFGSVHTDPVEAPWEDDDGWGWTRITNMEIGGENLTDRIEFIHPDDDNADDETVIRVPLSKPIAPGETARIEMVFESRIPRCERRTGWWHDDFFMMVHWFPKIGVYEAPGARFVPADASRGRWNTHQFHAGTEFFADYGVYDVEITLPEKYVVGTTGLIVSEMPNGDGTKTVVAHAEDVHEFVWVADAQFLEKTDVWRNEESGQSVDIRLLYQPGHGGVVEKYIGSVKAALEHVDGWLGPRAYPYPNITIVDPRAGSGAGGMEYPTLFTGGAMWWAEQLFGDGLRITEMVTVHEFLHQYWYGIVGNNEFEEAWLDEGLTTYSTSRIMAELYGGEDRTMLDWWSAKLGLGATRGGQVWAHSRNDASISDRTFDHYRTGIGTNLAYNKASIVLKTLENYLGRERFDTIMRTYFQRWKFRHPTGKDFVSVANEVAGENLDWFFDQVINQPISLDYAVASISNVRVETFDEGLAAYEFPPPDDQDDDANDDEGDDDEEDDEEGDELKVYQSTVVFRRVGEIVFPMDVLIEFSTDEIVRDVWDGKGRVKEFSFTRPGRVVRAVIDPDFKVPLDIDRLNNGRRVKGNNLLTNKYTFKGFFWMQSLLQFFSVLG